MANRPLSLVTMKPWGCQAYLLHNSSGLSGNRERLAGVQGAAMSPLVAARRQRNLGMDAYAMPSWQRSVLTAGAGRLGLHSTRRAAALLPGIRAVSSAEDAPDAQGPRTPASLSQYAASPLRYGQPVETVAGPHG